VADKRHALGRRGEDLAARHLEKLGYTVFGRNVTNRVGELDVVALDGRTVVAVEVKTRSSAARRPREAVDARKQHKLTLTAALFLQTQGWSERPLRFDVIEVLCPPGGAPIINHLQSAFEATTW
jgi:putative endonuclease